MAGALSVPSSVAERTPRVRVVMNALNVGGAERHVVSLLSNGVGRGQFTADVVCLKEQGPLAAELAAQGVRVRGPWLAHRYDATATGRLLRLGRQQPVDIVYTHHGVNEMALGYLSRLALRTRWVATVHATPPCFSRAQRWLLRRATRVVAVAPTQRGYLLDSGVSRLERTITIVNGVDHRRFQPAEHPVSDALNVGIVGSLTPEKGHAVLFEAVSRVVSEFPTLVVHVVGAGPCHEMLRTRAKQLSISQRVVFYGVRRDVEAVLRQLHVFVLPSVPLRETLSLAAIEAMACGVPVIASRVGSMADVLTDGCEGFLVEPGDVASLADRLRVMLADSARSRRMGAAARRRAEADFTQDAMVERYARLFAEICA